MTYIILAAGKGGNLNPLTLKYPKTSFLLDEHTTILQRLVRGIRLYDKQAEIVVVCGFMAEAIKGELIDDNVKFVINPFYEVTNSIASLWFARDYMERENVAIVAGDIVYDDFILENYLTKNTDLPYVLTDKKQAKIGTYNVVIENDHVLVMSKKLENYDAKYCGMTKLDAVSSRLLKQEIDHMINTNMYDQYMEDSLVQMIMFKDFQLYAVEVGDHLCREVDSVDDLLCAKKIHDISVLSQH